MNKPRAILITQSLSLNEVVRQWNKNVGEKKVFIRILKRENMFKLVLEGQDHFRKYFKIVGHLVVQNNFFNSVAQISEQLLVLHSRVDIYSDITVRNRPCCAFFCNNNKELVFFQ